MKLLHTGDWHVGKVLKGMSRAEEHSAVLAEMVDVADREQVDAVLVAGDVFESAAPPPEAQRVAWKTLLDLRETGAEVFVIAGNHDNAEAFEALRPVFSSAGVHMLGRPARPDQGGVVEVVTRAGEPLRVAALPFCSQRSIVRAEQLMSMDASELAGEYSERVNRLIGSLVGTFTTDAVNVVLTHAYVLGGRLGGGERDAQTVNDYAVRATGFPAGASYVALGHLHRFQQIPGPCPIHYAGSPIAVDFGEERDDKGVALVELAPGRPASVSHRILTNARTLATVKGTADGAIAAATSQPEAWFRAVITESARAGLADDIRTAAPNVLEVRLDGPHGWKPKGRGESGPRQGRTPRDLFGTYLEQQGIVDDRIVALFDELLDAEAAAGRDAEMAAGRTDDVVDAEEWVDGTGDSLVALVSRASAAPPGTRSAAAIEARSAASESTL